MNPEEFRQAGHQLIDWIADYRTRINDFPVMSQVKPGEVKSQLPGEPPTTPKSFDDIFRQTSIPLSCLAYRTGNTQISTAISPRTAHLLQC